jgi:hypothetical protein
LTGARLTAFLAVFLAAFFGAAFLAPFFGAAFLTPFFTAALRVAFFATTLRAPFLTAFLAVVFRAVFFFAAAFFAGFLAAAFAIVLRPSQIVSFSARFSRQGKALTKLTSFSHRASDVAATRGPPHRRPSNYRARRRRFARRANTSECRAASAAAFIARRGEVRASRRVLSTFVHDDALFCGQFQE